MKSPRLCAVVLLAVLAPAQRVWIVDKAGGAGVDFIDIPPALAAAAPGDTVRALGDSSVSYSPFTLSKGIVVETPTGASIASSGLGAMIGVTQIAAGQVARVSGFVTVAANPRTWLSIDVSACAGNVVLSGLQLLAYSGANLKISDSPAVLVSDCSISGRANYSGIDLGVQLLRSRAVFQRCSITGPAGYPPVEFFPGAPGGPALACQDSLFVCADSTVTGGRGGDAVLTSGSSCGTHGGPALRIMSGSGVILGSSNVIGGAPGNSTATYCAPTVPGAAADGAVSLSADVAVTGALVNGAMRARSLAWIDSPGKATLGAPVSVTLRGTPLTILLLHLDDRFSVTPLPGIDTPFLGTPGSLFVAALVLPGSGALPVTFTVPAVPSWAGRMFYLHALAVEPGTNAVSFTSLGDLLLR